VDRLVLEGSSAFEAFTRDKIDEHSAGIQGIVQACGAVIITLKRASRHGFGLRVDTAPIGFKRMHQLTSLSLKMMTNPMDLRLS
jgi:hypothetical protein